MIEEMFPEMGNNVNPKMGNSHSTRFGLVGLLFYGIYDFLMYGADQERADSQLREERRKRKNDGFQ